MRKLHAVFALLAVLAIALPAFAFETYDEALADAQAKIKARNYEGCRASCAEALKLAQTDEQRAKACLQTGDSYVPESKWADAQAAAAKVLELAEAPNALKAEAQCRVGNNLYWQGKYKESIAESMKVMDMPGANDAIKSTAWRYVGHSNSRMGDKKACAEAFTEVIKLPGGSNSYKMEGYGAIGSYLLSEGKPVEAREEYTKILSHPGCSDYNRIAAHLGIADTHVAEKNFAAARESVATAAGLEKPGGAYEIAIQYAKGDISLAEGKFEQALGEYRQAFAMKGAQGTRAYGVYAKISAAYKSKGDMAEANYNIGLGLLAAKNPKAAINYFNIGLKAADISEAAQSRIYAGIGQANMDLKMLPAAQAAFEKAAGFAGADPEAVKAAKEGLAKIQAGGN